MFLRLMAKFYDKIMADAEEKCLRNWRAYLLQDLSGDVLELGCGTGANLEFYPAPVKHLVFAEPDLHMRQKFEIKLPQYQHLNITVLDYSGMTIPVPNNSFDAVVSTLVLCSVQNQQQMLSEIYRILKPQGKLVFIEHVAAVNNPGRLKWQKRLEPFWKIIACGCHLTCNTEQNIIQAGFQLSEITRQSMQGVPAIVRPSIRGIAFKSK
jgi:ubiquinone/menaquinone biosynthesis C-methylase UbiE